MISAYTPSRSLRRFGLNGSVRLVLAVICLSPAAGLFAAGKDASYQAALESIHTDEIARHIGYLADKKLEGREAGTPGGYAAAEYLVASLRRLGLQPAGADKDYFQPFLPEAANQNRAVSPPRYRNILALLTGGDPKLKSQVLVLCAHYDHLGHGRRAAANPNGPIYPGADDNASGSTGVLELAQAFTLLAEPPKRSILIAFWDAEEKGLFGSKHWTAHPTVPLDHLVAVINIDMIGGLRGNRLKVFCSRTACGWRRLLCEQNREEQLLLDFPWQVRANADHYPFFAKNIPVITFHTGMHETYHQPSDDAQHINPEGARQVARLAFLTAGELANRPAVLPFRAAAGRETEDDRRRFAQPDPSPVQPGGPPLRVGMAWRLDDAEPGTVVVSHVVAGSPAAAAGLQVGDRICQVAGRDFPDDTAFAKLAATLPGPLELLVERDGRLRVVVVRFSGEIGVKRAA